MKSFLEGTCLRIADVINEKIKNNPQVPLHFFMAHKDAVANNFYGGLQTDLQFGNVLLVPLVNPNQQFDLQDTSVHFSSCLGASLPVLQEVLGTKPKHWVFGFVCETFISERDDILPSQDTNAKDGVIVTALMGEKTLIKGYELLKKIKNENGVMSYSGELKAFNKGKYEITRHFLLEAFNEGVKASAFFKKEKTTTYMEFVSSLKKMDKKDVLAVVLVEAMKSSIKKTVEKRLP